MYKCLKHELIVTEETLVKIFASLQRETDGK
jgi:hypothetical protein